MAFICNMAELRSAKCSIRFAISFFLAHFENVISSPAFWKVRKIFDIVLDNFCLRERLCNHAAKNFPVNLHLAWIFQ